MDETTTFSNTQIVLGFILSILSLLGGGIAVGRVLERVSNAEKRVDASLEAFKATLTQVVNELTNQYREIQEEGPIVLRSEWSSWRTSVDKDLGALRKSDEQKGESIHKIRGQVQELQNAQARTSDKLDNLTKR